MIKRLQWLEVENARLKNMYAEERLKTELATTKKMQYAHAHHVIAKQLKSERVVSIRLCFSTVRISVACYHHQHKLNEKNNEIFLLAYFFSIIKMITGKQKLNTTIQNRVSAKKMANEITQAINSGNVVILFERSIDGSREKL